MYDFWDIQSYICFSLLLMLFAGKVLLMLGKVRFELQKLIDSYVSAYCDVVNCSLAFHILFQKWVQPDINLLFLYFSAQIYSQQSRTLQNLSSMNFGQLRSVLVDFVCLAYLYLRSFSIIPICRWWSLYLFSSLIFFVTCLCWILGTDLFF